MKVAIMQPYFLPYIGYWQLINAVDKFVILDDVNYIKRGYINRNNILLNGQAYMFSIPVRDISQNRLIMDTKVCFNKRLKTKFLLQVEHAYKKAPQFEQVMPCLRNIIENETDDLTDFIKHSIEKIMFILGIQTELLKSSEVKKNNLLTAQNRIIEICKCLGTDIYINPSGGRNMYQQTEFRNHGIKLYFLDVRLNEVNYTLFKNEFVKNLSIIDVLMFNTVNEIKIMLDKYNLSEE